MNKVINLNIRTLSPVSILNGSNNMLSPYINAVLDENNIIELDMDKITDLIINDSKAFNMYLDILRNKEPNKAGDYSIINLIKLKSLQIKDITLRKIPCKADIKNLIEIYTCTKSNGKVYIPGSSLKGSIRTALLFNKVPKRDILKKLNLGNKRKGQSHFNYIGQDIFRNSFKEVKEDIFKSLLLRDAFSDEDVKYSVYEARSINLYENIKNRDIKFGMKLLIEAIDKNQSFSTQIIIKDNNFSKESIYNSINYYYENVISRELKEIKKLYSSEKYEVINQYNILLEKIRRHKENKDGFILRLGKLKGFFSNTINSQLSENELFKISHCEGNKMKVRKNIEEFPTTKWVIVQNNKINETLGWVEVNEE